MNNKQSSVINILKIIKDLYELELGLGFQLPKIPKNITLKSLHISIL